MAVYFAVNYIEMTNQTPSKSDMSLYIGVNYFGEIEHAPVKI